MKVVNLRHLLFEKEYNNYYRRQRMQLQRGIDYYIRPRMVLYDADNGIIEGENIIEDRQWYYRREKIVLQRQYNIIEDREWYYRR